MGVSKNELRIGNKVLYKGELFEIDFDSFNIIKELAPIELTEEILLKCGFEKGYTKGVLKLGDFTIDFYSKTFKFKREWIDINFKYLHQLQNLYWCLCGKELEIKL